MKTFYLEYDRNKKLQPLVAEIGWAHNIVLIQKVKNFTACRERFETVPK